MNPLVTSTLDPSHPAFPRQAFLACARVVSDVDYTLLDFDPGQRAGIQAVEKFLGKDLAGEVAAIFQLMIQGYRSSGGDSWDGKSSFTELVGKIETLESLFMNRWGFKPWSREVWIAIAAEKLGISLQPHEVRQASKLYWEALGRRLAFYPDAEMFLKWLAANQKPVVLMSASDCALAVNADGTFSYDPEYSRSNKLRRFERFFGDRYPVVIGDPIDKPDPRFFEEIFKEFPEPKNKILILGDSPRNDLEYPRKAGCPTVLIKRV